MLKRFVVRYFLERGHERSWFLFQPENRQSIIPAPADNRKIGRVLWSITPDKVDSGSVYVNCYEIFPETKEGLDDFVNTCS